MPLDWPGVTEVKVHCPGVKMQLACHGDPIRLRCCRREGISSLVQWLTTVSLDFDKARDYASSMPLVQQLYYVRVKLTCGVTVQG
jgi:hypothetical protein